MARSTSKKKTKKTARGDEPVDGDGGVGGNGDEKAEMRQSNDDVDDAGDAKVVDNISSDSTTRKKTSEKRRPPPPPPPASKKPRTVGDADAEESHDLNNDYFDQDYFSLIEKGDIPLEEEVLRNPCNLKTWLRYIEHKRLHTDPRPLNNVYERALLDLPGSYKLWKAYLDRRVGALLTGPADPETGLLRLKLPLSDPEWGRVNGCFERALVLCHKYPSIWLSYTRLLTYQPSPTIARRTFDRALRALPLTQHHLIWAEYLPFARRCGGDTAVRVWRRFVRFEPDRAEEFIDLLLHDLEPPRHAEAARVLSIVLEDTTFTSRRGKTKFQLWTDLCDLVTEHAESMDVPTADNLLGSGRGHGVGRVEPLKVDKVLRSGISKFTDQVGRLWCALATWYIAKAEFDRARDVYEEAMEAVKTVRDFTMVFDAYAEFEEGVTKAKMAAIAADDEAGGEGDDDERLSEEERAELDLELDLRLARLEKLIQRRPFLVNDVLIRQNPHNVAEWERRAQLWRDANQISKVIETYENAVATIKPQRATGKFHMLWVNFAKVYEEGGDMPSAREVLERAVQVPFKKVDDLAEVWCQWAEMELRRRLPRKAIEVMGRATVPPKISKKLPTLSVIKYQDDTLSPQVRLFKSLKLWSFYVDLEESIGTVESTRAVYDRIMELKIATPQIIINCAAFLEENKYFEESYKAFEKGIELFGYPIAFEIWNVYLEKFVARHGSTKLERARDLFEHALEKCPPKFAKAIYLMYAKLEEDHGLARRAMKIYDRATRAVDDSDRFGVYTLYVAKATSFFGLTSAREIYTAAIEVLPDKQAREMCVRFAQLEAKLLEVDRARGVWSYGSQFADPRMDPEYWRFWQEFEVKHGNEDTFKEMLRIKRSVQAKFNTDVGFISSQLLAQRAAAAAAGQTGPSTTTELPTSMSELEREAIRVNEELMREDEERSRAANGGSNTRVVGFVPARAKGPDGKPVFKSATSAAEEAGAANPEEIEIADDDDDDDADASGAEDGAVGGGDEVGEEESKEAKSAPGNIVKKPVPLEVFGGLVALAEKEKSEHSKESGDKKENLGAKERFKRKRQ